MKSDNELLIDFMADRFGLSYASIADEREKQIIKNSFGFAAYRLSCAIDDFKRNLFDAMPKWIKKFLK